MAFIFKQAGSSYWYAGWKNEDGKRINRTTKLKNVGKNRKLAQKIADEYESASREARTTRQVRETIAELHLSISGKMMASTTPKKYCDQFMLMKRGESSPATMGHYKNIFKDFNIWLGERQDEDLAAVSASDMASFRNHLLTKVSETTVAKKMKGLRSLFRAAMAEGLILEEPTVGMKIAKKVRGSNGRSDKRPFTLDELKTLLLEAEGEWRSMILFGLYTGQRLGDLATLSWSSLNLEKGELVISTRKTGRRVTIPLASPLLKHLKAMARPADSFSPVHPVLAQSYEENGSGTLSNQFGSLLARCGLREPVRHDSKDKGRDHKRTGVSLSFHCLRSTAVTLLHEAGIPAATVEEWVGHDSSEVHRTYVKIGKEALQRASDALPDLDQK